MSQRNDILENLREEMEEKIQTGDTDYEIGIVKSYRGTHLWTDVAEKPAVCFSCFRDEVVNNFGGSGIRNLHLFVYGYAETDGDGNTDDIHKLARDIEFFFWNDYSLTNDVEIGDIEIIEGGISRNQSLFTLEIRIKYEFTESNI